MPHLTQSELNSENPNGRREAEPTPARHPPTSTYALWHVCSLSHTHNINENVKIWAPDYFVIKDIIFLLIYIRLAACYLFNFWNSVSSCVKGLQNPFHINKRPSWRSYFKKTELGAAGSGAICSLSLTAAWLSYVWSVCQHNSLDSDCLPLRWLILELRPRGEPVPSIWFRTRTIPPWLEVSLFRNLLFSKHRNYESFAEVHTDWWHCHPGMRSRLCQDRFGGGTGHPIPLTDSGLRDSCSSKEVEVSIHAAPPQLLQLSAGPRCCDLMVLFVLIVPFCPNPAMLCGVVISNCVPDDGAEVAEGWSGRELCMSRTHPQVVSCPHVCRTHIRWEDNLLLSFGHRSSGFLLQRQKLLMAVLLFLLLLLLFITG